MGKIEEVFVRDNSAEHFEIEEYGLDFNQTMEEKFVMFYSLSEPYKAILWIKLDAKTVIECCSHTIILKKVFLVMNFRSLNIMRERTK